MATYDFTDPRILQMVEQSHIPTEMPTKMQTAPIPGEILKAIPLAVVCTVDREPWPCDAIAQLRAFKAINPASSPPRFQG